MEALIGYGKSYASFGELAQGRLSDKQDFLVTIPVDLWCTCEIICLKIEGSTFIECELSKSKAVANKMVEILNIHEGFHIKVIFTRNIPIGKGLSSSTADMLAVVRAFQEIFGVIVTETFISKVFSEIEAHDALHYYMSVVYNHRQGYILDKLYHIPQYSILAIDEGTEVDSVEYNKRLFFSEEEMQSYDELVKSLLKAFKSKDDVAIAKLATISAEIHAKRCNNGFIEKVLQLQSDIKESLGVIVAHSGSFAGIIFPKSIDGEIILCHKSMLEKKTQKDIMMVKTLQLI